MIDPPKDATGHRGKWLVWQYGTGEDGTPWLACGIVQEDAPRILRGLRVALLVRDTRRETWENVPGEKWVALYGPEWRPSRERLDALRGRIRRGEVRAGLEEDGGKGGTGLTGLTAGKEGSGG